MKIAVFGTGGVGGYFGGRLAEAGEDVIFIARGAHLEAIGRQGLRVDSVAGDFTIHPARATNEPAGAGPCDVVLVCVKAWDVPRVARELGPLLGPSAFVVPLENGIEAPDQIAAEIGADRVVPGLCRIVSYVDGPGRIRHAAVEPSVEFNETGGGESVRVASLKAAFERCRGVKAKIPSDIRRALWGKFLFIAPYSAVGAATRLPAGKFRDVPECRELLAESMREVVRLSEARGVALPGDSVGHTMRFVDSLAPESTSSMQRDVQEGRPSELDAQIGAVVRLAHEAGLRVPASEFLYAVLAPSEQNARKTHSTEK